MTPYNDDTIITEKPKLNFQELEGSLLKESEKAQITFMYRYIYNNPNFRVLIALHKRLTKKLHFFGLLNLDPSEVRYDESSIPDADREFKRLQRKNSDQNIVEVI